MRSILSRLDERWIRAASRRATHNLLELFRKTSEHRLIDTVLGYIPYFRGEVDISFFLSVLPRSTKVYLPRITDSAMQFIPVENAAARLHEPTSYSVDAGSDEVYRRIRCPRTVVIVPGIAFDRRGARLGRGRGHYDAFLQEYAPAYTVGVGWDFQILESLPVQPHDQPVQWLCTERSITHAQSDPPR